ncbi:hypothetical protein BBAD15_g6463 [Beauveria bassiana D1-5]|uniref:Uncharacterized protein n=1 Tax=Beauveria bassiana D1-5 TaxID=1245745 RepID=A0A0A2VKW6_BEABA|nr:hypothetical protein BBAD15_g6463 [Beauveria bassiana D1-5]
MMNNSTALQTVLPLRHDTYLVDEKDSELVGRLVRIYRTYAFSLSSLEQQDFRQMIRKREYKRGGGRPDPSNIVLHHWALLATLYSAESLAELAKVVTKLGIDRQPCWQKYADHHDGDDEKGDDNLGPLELPNAAELASVCTKRVRFLLVLREQRAAATLTKLSPFPMARKCSRHPGSITADNIALRKIVDASEANSIALHKKVDALEAKTNAQDVDEALLQDALAREREQNCLLLQRVHKLEESHKSYSPIMDKIYQKILEYTIRTDELARNHQKRDEALLKTQTDVEECRGSVEECQAGVEECHTAVEEYRADLEQCRSGVKDCHKVVEECQAGMEERHKVVEKCRTGIEDCQMAVGNLPADLDRVKVSIRRMVETSMRKSDERLAEELRRSMSFHRKNTTGSLRDMNREVQKALEETKRLAQQCSDENLDRVVKQKVAHLFELVGGIVKRGLEDKD